MAGEAIGTGTVNERNPFWFKVQQEDDKPKAPLAGAYMAIDIGNFLNGTKEYA